MESGRISRLVKRAQEGDKRAFEKLIRSKSKYITYITLSMLKNQHDAEDAAQDAIESMLSHISKLQNPDAFETWMYRIVFHACLKIQNRGKKQKATDFEEISSMDIVEARTDFLPQESNEKAETSRLLLSKIKDLPDNYRNCLYLFYYEEMSYDQIAEALGSSVKDVANWLDRGRKKLKAEFGYEEIREKRAVGIETSLLASAFALDIKETVLGQHFVENALKRIFAETAVRTAEGLLSTTAGKLALAGAVVLAVGIGGLLLNGFFPQDDTGTFSTDTATAPTTVQNNDRRVSPTATTEEEQERRMEATGDTEATDSTSNNVASGQPGSGSGGTAMPGGSEVLSSSGEIIIENEVLYGPDDLDDPNDPSVETDPINSSNEVTTSVPIGQEEAASNGSGLPLSRTGDFMWLIVSFCGTAALAAAAALLVAQRVKRR